VLTHEHIAAQKTFIMEMASQLRDAGQLQNVPFEVKRQIIKLVVNQITVDTREQWIRVEGAISKTYALVSVAVTNRSEPLQIDLLPHSVPIDITSNHIQPRA